MIEKTPLMQIGDRRSPARRSVFVLVHTSDTADRHHVGTALLVRVVRLFHGDPGLVIQFALARLDQAEAIPDILFSLINLL